MTLYHGTRRGFRGKGGLILPREAHGGRGSTAPVNPGRKPPTDAAGWVYVTTDLDLAWVYAYAAPGRGRPRVCVVEPLGPVEHDPEHSYAMPAFRTSAAVVKAVLTEPTITETEATEGWLTA